MNFKSHFLNQHGWEVLSREWKLKPLKIPWQLCKLHLLIRWCDLTKSPRTVTTYWPYGEIVLSTDHLSKNVTLLQEKTSQTSHFNHGTFIFFKREKNPHSQVKTCEEDGWGRARKVGQREKQEPLNTAAGRLYRMITWANKLFLQRRLEIWHRSALVRISRKSISTRKRAKKGGLHT